MASGPESGHPLGGAAADDCMRMLSDRGADDFAAGRRFARISGEELRQRIDQHRDWLDSDGREGAQACLTGVDLSATDLSGVNLGRAILRACSLRNAMLGGATLTGADLGGVDLTGADLSGASLVDADLAGCCGLGEALLTDADFSGARGLTCADFAGADLTGARLPELVACFDKLRYISDVGQIARPIYLFLLVFGLFSFLSIVSTTDAALIANSPSAVLPNLSTQIPAASLFQVAPVLLIFLYIYLHLYLLGVWEALSELPAVFPDGTALDKKAHAWIITSLIGLQSGRRGKKSSFILRAREWVVIVLVWGVAPMALFAYWWRYLVAHDPVGSLFHIGFFLVSLWVAVTLFRLAVGALNGHSLRIDRKSAIGLLLQLAALGIAMVAVSAVVIREPVKLVLWGKQDPEHSTLFVANVESSDFSDRPTGWDGNDVYKVAGGSLRDADMRYAFAQYAFFVNADMRKADLSYSDVYAGDFRAANLEKAKLDMANLDVANFADSCLRKAQLNGADLEDAVFDNAYLGKAGLSGAELVNATFINSFMPGVDLTDAWLDSADLSGATLTCYQKHWRASERVCSDLSWATLSGTRFSQADMRFARLEYVCATAARFDYANLDGASFRGADLSGSSMRGISAGCRNIIDGSLDGFPEETVCADFTGANMTGVELAGADLRHAIGLTTEQLRDACGSIGTRLPEGVEVPMCGSRPLNPRMALPAPVTKQTSNNPCWQNIAQDMWPRPQ